MQPQAVGVPKTEAKRQMGEHLFDVPAWAVRDIDRQRIPRQGKKPCDVVFEPGDVIVLGHWVIGRYLLYQYWVYQYSS